MPPSDKSMYDQQWYENSLKVLLKFIGEDPDREGLKETPKRVLKAWEELLGGYHVKLCNEIKTFDSTMDEMVVVRDIEFTSFCEHHWLPFQGVAHVGYIPKGKVIGLSKIPRIVDAFARRLQIQENLTEQIATTLTTYIENIDVGVVIEASHMCCTSRGIKKANVKMVTSYLLGRFKGDPATRAEFLKLVGK